MSPPRDPFVPVRVGPARARRPHTVGPTHQNAAAVPIGFAVLSKRDERAAPTPGRGPSERAGTLSIDCPGGKFCDPTGALWLARSQCEMEESLASPVSELWKGVARPRNSRVGEPPNHPCGARLTRNAAGAGLYPPSALPTPRRIARRGFRTSPPRGQYPFIPLHTFAVSGTVDRGEARADDPGGTVRSTRREGKECPRTNC